MENKELDTPEQIRVRYEKRRHLLEQGKKPYANGFVPKDLARTLHQNYDEKTQAELETAAVKVSVAGRLIAIRDFGKGGFVRLRDHSGDIQLYIDKKTLSEEAFLIYKQLDVGDLIHTQGVLFKTKTNELTIKAE